MRINTSTGMGKRKRLVTHCNHCQFQNRERLADFVHLHWAPASDLGAVGLCWSCYNKAAKDLIEMYRGIMTTVAEIEALYASPPEEEQRTVRPITPPI
jgi:hypothetical protein